MPGTENPSQDPMTSVAMEPKGQPTITTLLNQSDF